MNLSIYLNIDSFDYQNQDNHLLNVLLINLREVRELLNSIGEKIYRNDKIFDVNFFSGIALWQVIYGNEGDIAPDERRFLMEFVNQCSSISDEEYCRISQEISNKGPFTKPVAFIDLYPYVSDVLHIHDKGGVTKAHRFYLQFVTTPEEYISSTAICFPELHFHSDIIRSLRTLSAPISEYANEITRHLSAINDEFQRIFEDNKHQGLNAVMSIFAAQSQIAASLEGDLEKKKRLIFTFEQPGDRSISILCEPHTKLEGTMKPGDTQYRYDRIYFHQGSLEIFDGKVLIAHIGEHR